MAHLRALLHDQGAGQGTGLGLAMVFGFVKRSAGYIKVVSEPDREPTFQIFLPRAAETEDAQTPTGAGIDVPEREMKPFCWWMTREICWSWRMSLCSHWDTG